MTTPKFRIIIVGLGLIGPRHAQSVQSHPATELVAFIDPSPSAQAIGKEFGVPVYSSLDDLLSASTSEGQGGNGGGKPDAAVICTPNHTHIPLTLDLLKRGIKNILLEKPISDSIDTTIPLLSALRDPLNADARILVGHHRRFNPYSLSLKSLLKSGELGSILGVSGLWTLLKPISYFKDIGEWRSQRGKGGVLGINLIHDVDLLQFLFGSIIRVYAEESSPQRSQQSGNENEHTAEEGVALTLRFASGIVGTFLVNDTTPSPWTFEVGTGENPNVKGVLGESDGSRDCYRIFGTRGSVSFPDLTVFKYASTSGDEHGCGKEAGWNIPLSATKLPVHGKEVKPFDTQWGHFVRVIEGKEEVNCSVEDGVRALRVVGAVRESMESGRAVTIEA
ncbi:Gfo/Idh/MocA family protein [Aspergillus stella-maris]|uniref:Gfo/Idh/MocA family protein n=1 Tax=Aspergillus stella-maris TaxID=1810926 RepID=UPI003CCDC651